VGIGEHMKRCSYFPTPAEILSFYGFGEIFGRVDLGKEISKILEHQMRGK
jgi:hypothetical protein